MTAATQIPSLADAWTDHVLPHYPAPDLALAEGQGVHVQDAGGDEYLDLLAGLAVASTGHAHPHVVEAVQDQAETLLHCSNLYANPPNVELAAKLTAKTGMGKAAFLNSGGEANELALKIVRRQAHEHGAGDTILAFEDGFHGRSMGALTLTGQPEKQAGFGPLLPGIVPVPYNDPDALEEAFQAHDVAGVFYEPVQGEGGIVPMEPALAATLADLADDHEALLVADEVQTGCGRTGAFLASQPLGLEPDVVTLAKGIASGVPMGVTLVDENLEDLLEPGDHGCTFGGNPLASAAALATLEVIEQEALVDNAAHVGSLLAEAVADLPGIADVRGHGLLLGATLDDAEAGALVAAAQEEGLLVGTAGDGVLRLAPPLILEPHHVEAGAAALEAALREVVA